MKTASVTDWTTWPFLKSVGAGLVGAAAIFLLLRATPSLLMLQPTITNPPDTLYQQQQEKSRALNPAAVSTLVPAASNQQLNTVPHPLYME
jgi:heme/copper-type cytochrome/quinol oxidase subunit 1